jgi:CRP/FNR family transcriptional regulator, cyclic AMP receptor protein
MRKVLYILILLTDADVDWIADNGLRRSHAAGDVLVAQNQPIDSLMIVLEGRVRVEAAGSGAWRQLGSGEILGEMALIDDSPPSVSVIALEESQVLHLDRALLNARLEQDPHFAARLYRAIAMFLSARMHSAVQRLGYGAATLAREDEIEPSLLDNVHIAGGRFDRMVKKLMNPES